MWAKEREREREAILSSNSGGSGGWSGLVLHAHWRLLLGIAVIYISIQFAALKDCFILFSGGGDGGGTVCYSHFEYGV